VKLYAVIPTHNRPAELAQLLATIGPEVQVLATIGPEVQVLVIDNASTPPIEYNAEYRYVRRVTVMRDEEQPPNLSRLWNLGLDWAQRLRFVEHATGSDDTEEWAVAILNDDVLLSPGLLQHLADELTAHDVDIAFPGSTGLPCYVNKGDPFPGVGLRLRGWCFVVRGSSGLRADESLRWWCGDDDLQAQAVENGRGTVSVRLSQKMDAGLWHKHPDESTTGALREQTEKDMATFVAKWGRRPW